MILTASAAAPAVSSDEPQPALPVIARAVFAVFDFNIFMFNEPILLKAFAACDNDSVDARPKK